MLSILNLVQLLASLYCCALFLRFLAQKQHIDFRNDVAQLLFKISNPLLMPLRRVVPGWKGLDLSPLVLIVIIMSLVISLLTLITGTQNIGLGAASLVFKLFNIAINTAFYAIIANVIISWLNRDPYNSYALFFDRITSPYLAPIRRFIPPLGGTLDISPLIFIIVIYVAKDLLTRGYLFAVQFFWPDILRLENDLLLIRIMLFGS